MPEKRGPGRPRGSKSKWTKAREAKAAETIEQAAAVLKDLQRPVFGGDAHALLCLVYKDGEVALELRVDAAKAAIRYEKPALAQVQAEVKGNVAAYVIGGQAMSAEEWAEVYGVSNGEG